MDVDALRERNQRKAEAEAERGPARNAPDAAPIGVRSRPSTSAATCRSGSPRTATGRATSCRTRPGGPGPTRSARIPARVRISGAGRGWADGDRGASWRVGRAERHVDARGHGHRVAGPDHGQGGSYLVLPPGYQGDTPDGYFVARPRTYGVWLWRARSGRPTATAPPPWRRTSRSASTRSLARMTRRG
jgi:hypothetical protein